MLIYLLRFSEATIPSVGDGELENLLDLGKSNGMSNVSCRRHYLI